MEKNKIDDIYGLLDEITLENEKVDTPNKTVDEVYKEVNSMQEEMPSLASMRKNVNQSRIVKKPAFPSSVFPFDRRMECFEALLKMVDYGTRNSETYVEGHRDALEKYYQEASRDPKNLFVMEARVNEEIQKYVRANKTNLYVKGYYDGLLYVYKALKRSKELMANRIYQTLKRELN